MSPRSVHESPPKLFQKAVKAFLSVRIMSGGMKRDSPRSC
ncbi:hypothetical protein RGE_35610 [Rubrivivax gelatinosus IL144]|uniref:Uncharacterized protein n=1 Tax=Rubrivivax gelatinosus (strain NBRC 100245 / IL144) TaxID=983917 RepID=I0HV63_RUBGI|nr:hypothetical protein RGE_35610 [Rubrivivax gelatinosus IL144]